MYRAKAAGRDCFRIFTEAMDADVQRRDQIESSLRSQLRDGARARSPFPADHRRQRQGDRASKA